MSTGKTSFAERARLAYLLPLLAVTAWVLRWSINPDNYFFADDWAWLNYAENTTMSEWLRLFPNYIYNDRPAGALLIRAIYKVFGLDQVAFHAIFVALHLVNVVLAFSIARRLLDSDKTAFCAALLFGCWGSALTAPTWVAAVFDLLCCTLILAATLVHLAGKSPWLTLGLFVLAIRTKEIAIMLPLLLLTAEAAGPTRWNKEWLRNTARTIAPTLIATAVYAVVYFRLHQRYPLPEPNPYHLTVGIGSFTSGMQIYLGAFLYYARLRTVMAIGFMLALAASVALRWRAESIGLLGFLLFLLPVLFLPRQRVPLYLYLPSAFFWIGLIALAWRLLQWLTRDFNAARLQIHNLLIALALFAIGWQFWFHYIPSKVWALNHFRVFRLNIEQLKRIMPSPEANTRLFITGLPNYMNVFDFGPCHSVRLAYRQRGMDCVIYKSPEETRKLFDAHSGPKLLLFYKDGEIKAAE